MLGIEEYFWFLPWIQNHMKVNQLPKFKPYKSQFFAWLMRLVGGEELSQVVNELESVSPSDTSEPQTRALLHKLAKMHEDTRQEMQKHTQQEIAKMQQEMAKLHAALQTLSQVIQESTQH